MVARDEFSAFSQRPRSNVSAWPYMVERGLMDARPQISRAPDPIVQLRGSHQAAVTEGSETDYRVPQWQIWKHIPELKAFEAMALSLNIDPRKVRHSHHSWMLGTPLFDE
jgi:hypothetical protein